MPEQGAKTGGSTVLRERIWIQTLEPPGRPLYDRVLRRLFDEGAIRPVVIFTAHDHRGNSFMGFRYRSDCGSGYRGGVDDSTRASPSALPFQPEGNRRLRLSKRF
jgi:hypothetical protein